MEPHQLLHIAHLGIHGQLHFTEYLWHHARATVLMPVEGPASLGMEALSGRLCYVVQDGGPAQPEVIGVFSDVVKHL